MLSELEETPENTNFEEAIRKILIELFNKTQYV